MTPGLAHFDDSEANRKLSESVPSSPAVRADHFYRALVHVLVFCFLLGVVILLQWRAGTYHSELGGYPDEASHYVTGLMLRELLTAGPAASPLLFAENYYLHCPLVAIGHWPPVLYILEAGWMLLTSASVRSVMVLMALITAALAFTLYWSFQAKFGALAGTGAALLLICSPLMQRYTAMVNADTLVALLSFWAVLAFSRYVVRDSWHYAVLFGGLAGLALLTKGNAFALALVPPGTLLLRRQWSLVRRCSFWIPLVVVILLCGPWYWLTRNLVRNTWVQPMPALPYTLHALRFYFLQMVGIAGGLVLIIALVGFCFSVIAPLKRREVDAPTAGLSAFFAATLILLCALPTGTEARFLIPLAPSLIFFLPPGIAKLAQWIPSRTLPASLRVTGLAAVLGVVFITHAFYLPKKSFSGFGWAAKDLIWRPTYRHSVILISSDAMGEGVFISEIASRELRPAHIVLRATKIMSATTWAGSHYTDLYPTPRQMMHYFQGSPAAFVVDDQSVPDRSKFEHQRVLEETIKDNPQYFTLMASYPIVRNGSNYPSALRVYELPEPRPSVNLELNFGNMLNGVRIVGHKDKHAAVGQGSLSVRP